MKITEISLRRPVTVLIITIATVIFGAYSYMNMGVERMPNVEFPIVVVRTTLEGASPAIVDNDVTDVLESRINTIEGIKSMSSSSYEGRSVIVVEFELDRDIDFATALPDDCDEPEIDKFDPSDRPIMRVAVKNDGRTDMKTLSRYVDQVVQERLQTVRGVGGVQLPGFREKSRTRYTTSTSSCPRGASRRGRRSTAYASSASTPPPRSSNTCPSRCATAR